MIHEKFKPVQHLRIQVAGIGAVLKETRPAPVIVHMMEPHEVQTEFPHAPGDHRRERLIGKSAGGYTVPAGKAYPFAADGKTARQID